MSIRIRALARSFRGRDVFTSDALEVATGGLIALRGANGSGKTTLLRILSTLTAPTRGDCWIDGCSIVDEPRRARASLGFVPAGDGGHFRKLTGRENLLLFGGLCGLTRRETSRAIDRWAELLPLERALETRFAFASSGMRQTLSLCRALLHDPRVLLLDEPSRALDSRAAAGLWSALRELSSTKTILFSSHDGDEWREAPTVWEIKDGTLQCSTSS